MLFHCQKVGPKMKNSCIRIGYWPPFSVIYFNCAFRVDSGDSEVRMRRWRHCVYLGRGAAVPGAVVEDVLPLLQNQDEVEILRLKINPSSPALSMFFVCVSFKFSIMFLSEQSPFQVNFTWWREYATAAHAASMMKYCLALTRSFRGSIL